MKHFALYLLSLIFLLVAVIVVGPVRFFRPHLLEPIPFFAEAWQSAFLFYGIILVYCFIMLFPVLLFCITRKRQWCVVQGLVVIAFVGWHVVPELSMDWETKAHFEQRMSEVQINWSREQVIESLGNPSEPLAAESLKKDRIWIYRWQGVRDQTSRTFAGTCCEYRIIFGQNGLVEAIKKKENGYIAYLD